MFLKDFFLISERKIGPSIYGSTFLNKNQVCSSENDWVIVILVFFAFDHNFFHEKYQNPSFKNEWFMAIF